MAHGRPPGSLGIGTNTIAVQPSFGGSPSSHTIDLVAPPNQNLRVYVYTDGVLVIGASGAVRSD